MAARTSGWSGEDVRSFRFLGPGPEKSLEALFVSTGIVALAEIGDKTQLLTLVLAARFKKPWPVVTGIVAATLANHVITAAAGLWLVAWVGADAMPWLLGVSFIAMAIWILVPDKLDDASISSKNIGGILVTTMVLFFLVEIGDKTQVATAALAARFHSFSAVVVGTTLGMVIANAPVAFFGEALTKRLPVRSVRIIAAGTFAVLGVGVLAFS